MRNLSARITKGATVNTFNNGKLGKIGKNEGVGELLTCLSPATFDPACIFKNADWLLNNLLNSFYLRCALGPATPDPTDPARDVSSGTCNSWFNLPGIGSPQKCINFNSAAQSATTCKAKCAAEGHAYEASGCDGATAWCWCR